MMGALHTLMSAREKERVVLRENERPEDEENDPLSIYYYYLYT
jgi:hypothetical protein